MLDSLRHLDTEIFLWINGHNSPFLDEVFYWISNPLLWLPVYALLLFQVFKTFRRRAWIVILFTIVLISLTDLTAFHLFKEMFHRLRPSHQPALEGMVHIVKGYRGGDFGFLSSHAANYTGLALFLGLLLRKTNRLILPLLLFWAFLISYSRIYLGVHYPADVACGALLGVIYALPLYQLYVFTDRKLLDKHFYFGKSPSGI